MQKLPNLLPYDGSVFYFGKILSEEAIIFYFKKLLKDIDWKHDEVFIFGKHIVTKRMMALYADRAYEYTYSKTTKKAHLWTPELLELKTLVEKSTKSTYNSCLLNLYHNGSEGMSWHSDDEKEMGKNASIASLSLGAERKFSFKHKKTKETRSLTLENGSLLLMAGATQQHWLHSLPQTKKIETARINLTFRNILEKV